MKKVIIIGAGGHAKTVADIIQRSGDYIVGFLDNIRTNGEFIGLPILGDNSDYIKYIDNYFIIAIGDSLARERIANSMHDVKWYTAIHPDSIISSINTYIGEGTVITANAIINPESSIGKHCIINSSAVVEHDNKIGNYSHISVGAKLAGKVSIGTHTWIGAGATVSNNISVCDNCMIGAGAVVIRDIVNQGTYVGVPAKQIK